MELTKQMTRHAGNLRDIVAEVYGAEDPDHWDDREAAELALEFAAESASTFRSWLIDRVRQEAEEARAERIMEDREFDARDRNLAVEWGGLDIPS